jgi:excisionase family DNA binding protein
VSADLNDWIGTPEAAELLAVTQRTVYRLIDEGKLTPTKLGRILRVRRSEVDRLRRDRGDGSAGVREPRRPLPSADSGAADLE